MTAEVALATTGNSPQHIYQHSLRRGVKNQAVILAAAHESTRLLFVVGQPLGQETHLTVSMSAAQTDLAEVFRQNQVPLFIQQLRAEIATTVQHVETLLSTLFPFTLFRNESRRLVSPPPLHISLGLEVS